MIQNTGWLNLTSFANDTSIGTKAWTNPGNAENSDDVYAEMLAFNGNDQITNYLRALQLVPGLPGHATIIGIEVRAECDDFENIGANQTLQESIRLFVNGVPAGENRASGGFPSPDAYVVWGGPTDLWGLSLTAAEVLATDFGWGLAAKSDFIGGNNSGLNIDHMQMRIYYDASSMFLAL